MSGQGAPEEILYVQKPHLGTDKLVEIIKNIRRYIEEHQGEVRFRSKVTDFLIEENKIRGAWWSTDRRRSFRLLWSWL